MSNAKHIEEYIKFLEQYLKKDADALAWVLAITKYFHDIDDIIDKDNTSPIHLLRTFEFAAIIYSSPFYQRNIGYLYPLVKMVSNTYMDSVLLEKQPEAWKRAVADGLRQTGNELILACIEVLHGFDIRREASMKLREVSWKTHHLEDGTPV